MIKKNICWDMIQVDLLKLVAIIEFLLMGSPKAICQLQLIVLQIGDNFWEFKKKVCNDLVYCF
jgi:hypothetical protein